MKRKDSNCVGISSETALNLSEFTPPNGVFEMPLFVKMSSNICAIRTVSAKPCVLVLCR